MSSPVTDIHSDGASIKWGDHHAEVRQDLDGNWTIEIDGALAGETWPSRGDAMDAANDLLRPIAGPNAAREGAEFGDG